MERADAIDGVEVLQLAEMADVRGSVRHVWAQGYPFAVASPVAEVYFSTVLPGVVKGWHVHKEMTLRYAVAVGRVFLGLIDVRPGSPTEGKWHGYWLEDTGPLYRMVIIPPGVANGFRAAADYPGRAVVLNLPDRKHDPNEIIRQHPRNFYPEFPWGDYALAG